MRRKLIYVAAPLFSAAERDFNLQVKTALVSCVDVFLPQTDGQLFVQLIDVGTPIPVAKHQVFVRDLEAIRSADALIIVLDGRVIDEGASFELGYAYALGKLCVGLRTDPRQLLPVGNNPMIECALSKTVATLSELSVWAAEFAGVLKNGRLDDGSLPRPGAGVSRENCASPLLARMGAMNVGVLASHEGTTLESLLDAFSVGRIQGRVAVVVSNNGDSGALRRARQAGVQAVHLSSKTHEDPTALDAAIRGVLVAADVDVVFLAGYMKKLGPLVLRAFEGRILNTHPALLPRFGGPGMYGDRVFEAVLEAGEAESGVSIHLVDADYDTGAIVRQCRVPVFRGDSLDDLKARVGAREKEFVVETLGQIAKGEIRLVSGAG
jgi:phosphoribosylglycinamide formyltransferase 1